MKKGAIKGSHNIYYLPQNMAGCMVFIFFAIRLHYFSTFKSLCTINHVS